MASRTPWWAIAFVVTCTVLVTLGSTLMKLGLRENDTILMIALDPRVLAGVALFFLGGFLLTYALKHGELSVLHPLMSLGFVWIVAASVLIGEVPTVTQLGGIVGIICGVIVIGRST